MDKSLFAIFRIVAAFLSCDGAIDPRERQWFHWLMGRYDLSPEQREILQGDLQNTPEVRELFREISRGEDRERLMDWIRIAIQIDKREHTKERGLYEEILKLEQSRAIKPPSTAEYANELVDYATRLEFYRDLASFGREANRHISPWTRRGVLPLPFFIGWRGLYLLLALACIPLAFVGMEYNRNLKLRDATKPQISLKLQTLCSEIEPCGNLTEFSDECADAAWTLTTAGCGRHYRGCPRQMPGFDAGIYLECLNLKARRKVFGLEHRKRFEEFQ